MRVGSERNKERWGGVIKLFLSRGFFCQFGFLLALFHKTDEFWVSSVDIVAEAIAGLNMDKRWL